MMASFGGFDAIQDAFETAVKAVGAGLSPLSHPAIALAAQSLSDVVGILDQLSARIGSMPDLAGSPIAGAAAHVSQAKALANGWSVNQRPAITNSMQSLKGFGSMFIGTWVPVLRADFVAGNPQMVAEAKALLTAISQNLQQITAQGQAAVQSIQAYLPQVEATAGALQNDASAAAARISADQQTVATLNQQAQDLQSKIDDARSRQKWYWLLGPAAAFLAQEIDSLASGLDGIQSQLDSIRSDAQTTSNEAIFLQALLPTMTGYVQAVNLLGASVNGLTASTQALQAQLQQVQTSIDTSPSLPVFANAQLDATVADWQRVAAAIG